MSDHEGETEIERRIREKEEKRKLIEDTLAKIKQIGDRADGIVEGLNTAEKHIQDAKDQLRHNDSLLVEALIIRHIAFGDVPKRVFTNRWFTEKLGLKKVDDSTTYLFTNPRGELAFRRAFGAIRIGNEQMPLIDFSEETESALLSEGESFLYLRRKPKDGISPKGEVRLTLDNATKKYTKIDFLFINPRIQPDRRRQ